MVGNGYPETQVKVPLKYSESIGDRLVGRWDSDGRSALEIRLKHRQHLYGN